MSTSPLLEILSQELVDEVIDWLQDDRGELCACSLTCHAFLPRSQYYLFRELAIKRTNSSIEREIGISTHVKRITDLLAILQYRPMIASYVRELHIYFVKDDGSWIYCDQTWLDVMKILDSIHTISFSDHSYLPDMSASSFDDNNAFMTNFWLPFGALSVRSVRFTWMKCIPPQIIFDSPNLCSVTLSHTTLLSNELPNGVIYLDYLDITNSDETLDILLSKGSPGGLPCLDLQHLRRFEFERWKNVPKPVSGKIIKLAAETLEQLGLRYSGFGAPAEDDLVLGSMPRLRALKLYVYPILGLDDLLFGRMIRDLQRASTTPLTQLTFEFHTAWHQALDPASRIAWLRGGWEPLDNALESFGSRGKIKLGICILIQHNSAVPISLPEEYQYLLDHFLERSFPKTASNPSFSIDYKYRFTST